MLIEFNGEITEKNQIDRHNRVKKKEILLFTLIPLLLDVIGIILGIAFNFIQDIWLEMLIYSLILWGIAIFVGKFPPKRALRFRLSSHIIITESEISKELLKDGQKVWAKKSISKVKKILDCGDVYYIVFKFGDITNAWICQKSNLINGELKNFEILFQSKIVRKP